MWTSGAKDMNIFKALGISRAIIQIQFPINSVGESVHFVNSK